MTLRRRLTFLITGMIAGVLLVGGGAVVGVAGLHQDFGVALQSQRDLRRAFEAGTHVSAARKAVARGDTASAATSLAAADIALSTLPEVGVDAAERLRVQIRAAAQRGRTATDAELSSALDAILAHIASFCADARLKVEQRAAAADAKRRATMEWVVGFSALVAAAASVAGVWQYRSVVNPLKKFAAAADAIAAGNLSGRVQQTGDAEFRTLAADFNRMAEQLENLLRTLEHRVAEQSRILVRSERLASVGYLAAGVSHEINNPLAIIAAYVERAQRQLSRANLPPESVQAIEKNLAVICEEAFRCKGITERLLSLAKPCSASAAPVDLAALVQGVVSSLCGLPAYTNRRVQTVAENGPALVRVAEGELKQVLTNLLVNAFDATTSNGNVVVQIRTYDGKAELAITDDGAGMSADTTAKAFEPFFTASTTGRRGTGLGLSISHAIVTAAGGSIAAQSDGAGQGSRFTVKLPLIQEAHHA